MTKKIAHGSSSAIIFNHDGRSPSAIDRYISTRLDSFQSSFRIVRTCDIQHCRLRRGADLRDHRLFHTLSIRFQMVLPRVLGRLLCSAAGFRFAVGLPPLLRFGLTLKQAPILLSLGDLAGFFVGRSSGDRIPFCLPW